MDERNRIFVAKDVIDDILSMVPTSLNLTNCDETNKIVFPKIPRGLSVVEGALSL